MRARIGSGGPAALAVLLLGCRAEPPEKGVVLDSPRREGDEIALCGRLFDAGTPVVLWFDPGGYSAYATRPVLSEQGPRGLRYRPAREFPDEALASAVERRGYCEPAELRASVDQLVIHYDACGLARECFRVLHDQRGLSAHFLLDVDGTLYQTLDLESQAWHARSANPRSIGIEIAHVGAFPPGQGEPAEAWYAADESGTRLRIPDGLGGVRTPDFAGRPARPEPVRGEIHGSVYEQYDFTDAQYDALAKLTAALARLFPDLELDAPRDVHGRVRTDALSPAELERHRGLLGHWHVTSEKIDPGPAFDWERVLKIARRHHRHWRAEPMESGAER